MIDYGNSKKPLGNRMDDMPVWIIFIICFLIAIPITTLLVVAQAYGQYRVEHRPCSYYENYKISKIPARCIKGLF